MRFLRSWKIRVLLFFAVVGPGFITANVDNDANGIVTFSLVGAQRPPRSTRFPYTALFRRPRGPGRSAVAAGRPTAPRPVWTRARPSPAAPRPSARCRAPAAGPAVWT